MKRTRFAGTLLAAAAAVTLSLGAPGNAGAAEKTLKLHHLNKDDPFDNATGAMATVFESLVESGTNGSIDVQTFPAGQLGKDAEVVQQVKSGVIQSGIHSVGGFASTYPMISVLDVPFAFPNISTTYEVFDGPFGERLSKDIMEKTGIKVLGFGDSGGFFHFTNSKRQIKSLEDMDGLKIRTMGLDTHKTMVDALGAQPTAIAWSEVYTALQTGVADGQMNPVPIIAFANFNEVQSYLTLSGHLFTPYVWAINKDFYDSLTEHERGVIDYAAHSAIVAGRGLNRIIESSKERGLPALEANMEVYAMSPEEKARFRDAALPAVKELISEKFGAEGTEMMEAFLGAIETASNN
ncbi:DctP family TRAP transporter solute-binding subunit [Ferruginivarius sediminum]|uniref:C4-dicarboxylate ABC transporter substrate-binding protein n=1 Tax=Ferruginivarius sediminum TaxID=2661937 RepID=A0A369TF92_9PROT|nr:DctP family TRAP transporter solute-binding subunit [Ferruginivarius sediminum]RDD62787.1 C4-dicarboxylate ABC transporter substrate-binding protein [Ferruginivarius sediminum]